MSQSHSQIASFIWSICNLLRGPYKRNEYRKVILPLTVLRRFDCILAPSKDKILAELPSLYGKSDNIISESLNRITGVPFYNKSLLDMKKLLDDPDNIAINLQSYINDFSPNVQKIIDYFAFPEQIARLQEANLLYLVIKDYVDDKLDLSPQAVDNTQMGLVFEELIRIGAEQSNEEAGEHFTPREVIKLMVNLLLSPEADLAKSHVVKTIFDPACGTGGMLTAAETYIKELNRDAKPHMYGQDWNKESYAVCCSDMLIKGEDATIHYGCSFEDDGFTAERFDYMLANPPFGVEWKKQQKTIIKNIANSQACLIDTMPDGMGRWGALILSDFKSMQSFITRMEAEIINTERNPAIAFVMYMSPARAKTCPRITQSPAAKGKLRPC